MILSVDVRCERSDALARELFDGAAQCVDVIAESKIKVIHDVPPRERKKPEHHKKGTKKDSNQFRSRNHQASNSTTSMPAIPLALFSFFFVVIRLGYLFGAG
jgi:hypothetical protein